jgi:hypothetical protein
VTFFEPLPPPILPSQRVWAPPAWDRPSEGTLPATLAIDALLQEDEDSVWTIPTLDVYPNGFRVNVALHLNPHRQQDIQQRIRRGPMGMMRVGVRFADGRVGGRGVGPAYAGAPGIPKDEDGVPTEPIVGFGGGGGGSGGWRFSAWVFPLPPDGPLEIFIAPPQPATGEFKAIVDGTAVRSAAEKARVIWS